METVDLGSSDTDEESLFGSSLTPEEEAQKNVEIILDQIIRLTVAIRKAGSGPRLLRADKSFDPQAPVLQDLKVSLELVIHPRGFKTDDNPLNEIQERLIDVNLRRRHRFLYAKQHSINLQGSRKETRDVDIDNVEVTEQSLEVTQSDQVPCPENVGQSSVPPLIPDPQLDLAEAGPISALRNVIPSSDTAASAIDSSIIFPKERAARPLGPATVLSKTTSRIVYPNPPFVPQSKMVFICPCCRQSLPVSLTERSQWKKHLAADIRPYTCTFMGCRQPFRTYTSRIEWESHIKSEHFKLWKCFICEENNKSVELNNRFELESHLRAEHQNAIEESEMSIFVDGSCSSKPPPNSIECPICPGDQNGDEGLEHIARCVHDFSLRSLPLPSEGDLEEYFAESHGKDDTDDADSASTDNQGSLDGLSDLGFQDDYELELGHELELLELKEDTLEDLSRFFDTQDSRNIVDRYLESVEEFEQILTHDIDITLPGETGTPGLYLKQKSIDDLKTTNNDLDESSPQDILNWLSPVDYAGHLRYVLSRRYKDTGKWFLQNPTFQNWIDGKEKTLLCSGMPGTGKTMIASIVLDHIRRLNDAQPISPKKAQIAVLSCSFKQHKKEGLKDFLKSLVRQLSMNYSKKPRNTVVDWYLEASKDPSFQVSRTKLLKELRSIIESPSRSFIIIDGLNECKTPQIRDALLTELYDIQSSHGVKLQLMMTVAGGISPKLPRSFKEIKIRAPREDIEQYLDGQVSRLSPPLRNNPELWVKIKTRILDATHGVWTIAESHIEAFTQEGSLKQSIHTVTEKSSVYVQSELNAMYDNLVDIIQAQEKEICDIAKRVLLWVAYSVRPLKMIELKHALAGDSISQSLAQGNLATDEGILGSCADLVTFDKTNGFVRLVHYTANDYFVTRFPQKFYMTQNELAIGCLSYIAAVASDGIEHLTESVWDVPIMLIKYPLLDYAARYWGRHMKKVQAQIGNRAVEFSQNRQALSLAGQVLWGTSKSGYSGIHIFAYKGLELLTEMALATPVEKNGELDLQDDNGWTPLFYAVEGCDPRTVDTLLRSGARIEARDKDHNTPLSQAIEIGQEGVIKILLHYKAETNYLEVSEPDKNRINLKSADLKQTTNHDSDLSRPTFIEIFDKLDFETLEKLFGHTGPINMNIGTPESQQVTSGDTPHNDLDNLGLGNRPKDDGKPGGRVTDQTTWHSNAPPKLSHAEWKRITIKDDDDNDLGDEDRNKSVLKTWKSGIEGEAGTMTGPSLPAIPQPRRSPSPSDDDDDDDDTDDDDDDEKDPFKINDPWADDVWVD
ncbi:hypothetical protein TWF506_004701 [Arthrobotrys conoides]